MNRCQAALASCLLAVLLAGPGGAEAWQREVPAAATGHLRVELDFGSVRVASHPTASVQILGDARGLGASEYRFALERDGDDLLLTGRAAAWLDLMALNPDVEVEILIPAAYSVEVATENGSVSVTSVSGAIVRTRAGSIEVRDIRGEVDVQTHGGGSVEIDGVSGEVLADAQDAPIRARFNRAPSGWLRANGGGVDIALGPGVAAQIDARAPGGCVFIENRVHSGCGEANAPVILPINGSGPTLQVRARSGDILMHTEQF